MIIRTLILGLLSIGSGMAAAHGAPPGSYAWTDWDGDGRGDLLVMRCSHENNGECELFDGRCAPKLFLRRNTGAAGAFAEEEVLAVPSEPPALRSDIHVLHWQPVDWDGDGDLDLLGIDEQGVWQCENVGRHDAKSLPRLNQPKAIFSWMPSAYRDELTIGRSVVFLGLASVDWEADGDLDLVASLALRRQLPAAESKPPNLNRATPLVLFELALNDGKGTAALPSFARPVIVRESRGLPVHASVATPGAPQLIDWDIDGDLDLLFFDSDPRSEWSGRLMYAENDGNRRSPLLLKPLPLLEVTGSPLAVDWNDDMRLDLIADGKLFINENKLALINDIKPSRRASGTRIPSHSYYPRLEPWLDSR